jgi:hypothetical protein
MYKMYFAESFTSLTESKLKEPQNIPSHPTIDQKAKSKKKGKKQKKKLHRKSKHKLNKCIFKVIKKGKKNKASGGKYKMHKKYVLPLILGLLAAKSLLIPIALKALAFLSAKGNI